MFLLFILFLFSFRSLTISPPVHSQPTHIRRESFVSLKSRKTTHARKCISTNTEKIPFELLFVLAEFCSQCLHLWFCVVPRWTAYTQHLCWSIRLGTDCVMCLYVYNATKLDTFYTSNIGHSFKHIHHHWRKTKKNQIRNRKSNNKN